MTEEFLHSQETETMGKFHRVRYSGRDLCICLGSHRALYSSFKSRRDSPLKNVESEILWESRGKFNVHENETLWIR